MSLRLRTLLVLATTVAAAAIDVSRTRFRRDVSEQPFPLHLDADGLRGLCHTAIRPT